MAVNLIARYDRDTAHGLLDASFANFSTGQRTEQLRTNLEDRRGDFETFRTASKCELGDIDEISDPGRVRSDRPADTQLLQPGAVLDIADERLVLLGRSWGGGQPKLSLTNVSGKRTMIRTRDLPKTVTVLGHLKLPSPIRTQNPDYRGEVGTMLETFVPTDDATPLFPIQHTTGVLACPDLETHLKWAERAQRAARDIRRLERRIARTQSNEVSVEFDNLMKVLSATGYVDDWSLTSRGESLRRLYNELDLLLGESIRSGVFDALDPAEFAALASMFTFQARGGMVSEMPRAAFAASAIEEISALSETIAEHERSADVVETRYPDVGLVDSIHAWASGLDLADIFDADDLRAGDFVRSARQLLDLLRQIRDAFPALGGVATQAIAGVDRGIVEAGVIK